MIRKSKFVLKRCLEEKEVDELKIDRCTPARLQHYTYKSFERTGQGPGPDQDARARHGRQHTVELSTKVYGAPQAGGAKHSNRLSVLAKVEPIVKTIDSGIESRLKPFQPYCTPMFSL